MFTGVIKQVNQPLEHTCKSNSSWANCCANNEQPIQPLDKSSTSPSKLPCTRTYCDDCAVLGAAPHLNFEPPCTFYNRVGTGENTPGDSTNLLNCIYSGIKSAADIDSWKYKFITSNTNLESKQVNLDTYNQKIMPDFCIQQGDKCVGGANTCSRMTSIDPVTLDGRMCKCWVEENPIAADVAKLEYCKSTEHDTGDWETIPEECKCILWEYDPLFEHNDTDWPLKCWYSYCQGEDMATTLIPSDQQTSGPGECPSTVCQDIINIYGDVGVQDNVRQSIACDGGGVGESGGDTDESPGDYPEDTEEPTGDPSVTGFTLGYGVLCHKVAMAATLAATIVILTVALVFGKKVVRSVFFWGLVLSLIGGIWWVWENEIDLEWKVGYYWGIEIENKCAE